MWKYCLPLLLVLLACSSHKRPSLPFNPSAYEQIDWSNKCVIDFLNAGLKRGERIKPLELIMVQERKDVVLSFRQVDGTEFVDTVYESVKLLDNRDDFNEQMFTGRGINAYLALSLAYIYWSELGDSCYREKTFTLNRNGDVIDCSDYISPKELVRRRDIDFAHAIKVAFDAMGKDSSQLHLTIDGKIPGE